MCSAACLLGLLCVWGKRVQKRGLGAEEPRRLYEFVLHAGALEQAMQVAESQGVLSSSDEVHVSNSNTGVKLEEEEGRTAKGNGQGKRRQDNLPQVTA